MQSCRRSPATAATRPVPRQPGPATPPAASRPLPPQPAAGDPRPDPGRPGAATDRPGRPTLLLVRHAASVPPAAGGPATALRPLTAQGRRQAGRLADELLDYRPVAVVSSPYLRAADTVRPLARRLGLPIEPCDGLQEWRSALEPTPRWMEHYRRCWYEPDFALPGGETQRQAQARALATAAKLGDRCRRADGPLVAASHGALIALLLRGLGAPVDADFWFAMPTPAVYRLVVAPDGSWRRLDGPGITQAL